MTAQADVLQAVAPADDLAGPRQGRFTYDDYAALPEDGQRYEIVDGVLYMTPSPNADHQGSSVRFVYHLMTHVEIAGIGRVFVAPFDVELSPLMVVQPDVVVVLSANAGIITPSRIVGAPDLVVEIASPSTAGYDRRAKQDAYAAAGVREYWIADPSAQMIEVLDLQNGAYRSLNVFRGNATLPSRVVPNLPVAVSQFFL